MMAKPEFVYVSYIATSPEKLWDALTQGEFTKTYWYGRRIESDWQPGAQVLFYDGDSQNVTDSGVEIASSSYCTVEANCFERNSTSLPSGDANYSPQRHALKLEGTVSFCKIAVTHSASSGATVDEAIVPASNTSALVGQNSVLINAEGGSRAVGYSSTLTPEVYGGSKISMTLSGNVTVANTGTTTATQAHAGSELELIFTQDATGGRTVTFGSMYRVSRSIDPAASSVTVCRLTFNGTVWAGAWERAEAAAAASANGYFLVPFKPGLYYGSHGNEFNTNQRAPNNFVAVPFLVTKTTTFDRLGFNVTTASTGNTRVGIYADDGEGYPGARLLDGGVVATGTGGHRDATINITLQPGLYWLVSNTESGSATFRSHLGINSLMPVLINSTVLINGYEHTSVASGSLPATAPAGMTAIGAATRMVVRAA